MLELILIIKESDYILIAFMDDDDDDTNAFLCGFHSIAFIVTAINTMNEPVSKLSFL